MKRRFITQSEIDKKVLSILDSIEVEMKKIGFWNENVPEVEGENCIEAMCFERWLQCVFLPNARKAAYVNEYPEASQVGLMAMREYDYHSCVQEALNLVALLHRFDEIVMGYEVC